MQYEEIEWKKRLLGSILPQINGKDSPEAGSDTLEEKQAKKWCPKSYLLLSE